MEDQFMFLGCFYPPNEMDDIRRNTKGGIQNASNLLQWDYINGIEQNLGCPISVMTRMSIGIYPHHYNKLIVRTHSFKRDYGDDGIAIGFFNTFPVRPFFFNYVGIRQVLNWADDIEGNGVLIAYSHSMAPIITSVKKRHPHLLVVLILPDLPRYTYLSKKCSMIYRFRRYMDEKVLKQSIKDVDILVPITRQMGELIDPENKTKKVIIDGMVNVTEDEQRQEKDESIFTIAYTGTLTKAYGILALLSAIKSISDPRLRLIICGAGEAESEIRRMQENDPRVVFKGLVSPEKAKLIQKKSNLLVNPRRDSDEYTKYSFPSKILQYMESGTPVLCYKLAGISSEYDRYLLYVEKDECIADAIRRVMRLKQERLIEIGMNARSFVQNEKTAYKQTRRLLDLIFSFKSYD